MQGYLFNIYCGWSLLTIIQICSSQTTTTLTSTTAETEGDPFFAVRSIELYVLAGIIIGCPICIALLCCWQKIKTKKFAKERAERTADIKAGAQQNRQRIQAQRQQQQRGAIQMQQRQNAPNQQGIHHGSMQETFNQNAAVPLNTSNAEPVRNINHEPSASKEKIPAPPAAAPSAPSAPQQDIALDMLSGTTSYNPPPADDKKKKKKKNPPSFMKVQSVSVIEKMDVESALVLPDVEDDADNEPPPESMPRTKTFDAITGAPQEPQIKVVNDNGGGGGGADLDWANPENYGRLNTVDVAKMKEEEEMGKNEEIGGRISIVQEKDIDDLMDKKNDDKKEDVALDMLSGTKEDDVIINYKDDDKKEDDDEDEDGKKEDSVIIKEDEEDDDEDMSDSSSGEALGGNADTNLLTAAHEQMSNQPPPSLQTIFGKVNPIKTDEEESSDEDSLMQRQQEYGNDPDGMDDIGSPVDETKPESTFTLNV